MPKNNLKLLIRKATIESISAYCEKQLSKPQRKFQVLDILMPKERLIRSVIGGMETSLGKTLWEPLAKAIAITNGFTVLPRNLESPVNMPASLANGLSGILEDRLNNIGLYDATTSHAEIKRLCQPFLKTPLTFTKPPTGFGVDIWLQKNGTDYFFDTKTVQPNVGNYSTFLKQVLTWYLYFYSKYPQGTAEARIVFPYNPHNGNYWQYTQGGGHPLEPTTEGWVEDEFWDFLSGHTGTFELIKETLKEISDDKTLESRLDKLFDRKKDEVAEEALDNLEE